MTINKLIQCAEDGLSMREAARLFKSSQETIEKLSRRYGIKFSRKPDWQRKAEQEFEMPVRTLIIMFAKDGYSKRLTAATIGIERKTLVNYAKREGIKFPDRSELRGECRARWKG